MAYGGSAQLTFTAYVHAGCLVCDRVMTTNGLDVLDPVDAIPALLDGQRVRVDGTGNGKGRLRQMWEQQVGGATECQARLCLSPLPV